MAENYVLLERTELNASATSVTFSNIPQTGYTDLKIVASMRDDYASVSVNAGLKINGSTIGLAGRVLFGTGTAANSTTVTDGIGYTVGTSGTTATFSTTEFYIPNYKSTSTYKTYAGESAAESNTTTVYMQILAGLWSSNSAITSLTIYPQNATNFVSGSTFSLYGIAEVGTSPAIAPKASGGNVIATDGTYWYHAFLASGTFTPALALSCDVLQIAGGGGGGNTGVGQAGGGGAGGVSYLATQSLTATSYTCTVGAGGAGGGSGTSGVNSQFGSLTAAVGGGRGAHGDQTVFTGGSGGGAFSQGGSITGGANTSGQGNVGGNASGTYAAGGGGGAGAAGGNAGAGSGAAGGVGSSSYSSWGSATSTGQNVSGTYYYAGGGASSSSFSGGYGGGGNYNVSGTANTGGGGGANGGAAGGSGIIIIRYPIA